MKNLLFILIIISFAFSGLYEDKTIDQNISITAYVDCLNKTVIIHSNKYIKAYLLYGTTVVGSKEGKNISIEFFGKIPNITEPFTIKIEEGDNRRFLTFWIEECENESLIYLVNEAKNIEFNKTEMLNQTNQTEEVKDTNKTNTYGLNETSKNITSNSNSHEKVEETKEVKEENREKEEKEKKVESKKCILPLAFLLLGLIQRIK